MSSISFGDTVRIRATGETERLGLAGQTGTVYGLTTPSVTGVQVIGSIAKDRALVVNLEGKNDPLWFDPELVEFLNHTPGTTITIGGRSYIRDVDGEWIDEYGQAKR